jgi:hypothetical protein
MNNIRFYAGIDDNCCGIIQVGNFNEEYGTFLDKVIPPKWNSTKFEETLIDYVVDIVSGNNQYSGGGYLLQCSLVSSYGANGTKQYPILQDYLLESGWVPMVEFKNANTGHLVTTYNRFLPEEEINTYLAFYNGDEEGSDDEW